MSIGSRRRDREGLAIVITWRHEKPIGDVSRHIWIPPKVARAHLIITMDIITMMIVFVILTKMITFMIMFMIIMLVINMYIITFMIMFMI